MRLQINVMGEMLTEEEKERYDIIRTNISNGTKLVIPERGGAGVAVDEQEKQEVPAVLKVRTRGVQSTRYRFRTASACRLGARRMWAERDGADGDRPGVLGKDRARPVEAKRQGLRYRDL